MNTYEKLQADTKECIDNAVATLKIEGEEAFDLQLHIAGSLDDLIVELMAEFNIPTIGKTVLDTYK